METCKNCDLELPDENAVCTCQCKRCGDIVFDPVLAYCQSFLKNYSVAEVAKAVESFFSSDDVIKARELIRSDFAEKVKDLEISRTASRRTTINRSHLQANAVDVVEATYHLSQNEGPRFMVDDISQIPILRPNLANARDQAASLLMLEKRLERFEEKFNEKIAATDEILKDHDQQLHEHKVRKSTSLCATSDYGLLSLPPPATGFGRNPDGKKHTAPRDALENDRGCNQTPAAAAAPEDRQSSWSAIATHLQENSEDWKVVESKRKPHNRQNQTEKRAVKKRPAPMQGTATDTEIKAGSGPSRDLWVYNVHKDMSDEALRKYIEDGGSKKDKKVNVRLWEPRYQDHHEYKCFRLSISKFDYEYVFQPDFWPLDVHFRKYWLSKEEFSAIKNRNAPASK